MFEHLQIIGAGRRFGAHRDVVVGIDREHAVSPVPLCCGRRDIHHSERGKQQVESAAIMPEIEIHAIVGVAPFL